MTVDDPRPAGRPKVPLGLFARASSNPLRSLLKRFAGSFRGITWVDLGRGFIPAALEYGLTAAGLAIGAPFPVQPDRFVSPFVGVLVVAAFTLTHAVLPIFFYRFFLGIPYSVLHQLKEQPRDASSPKSRAGDSGGTCAVKGFLSIFIGFGFLHMIAWFGGPSVFLAFHTSWLPLIGIGIHLVLARGWRRLWVFLEYGSTSMSLLILLAVVGMNSATWPWVLLALGVQGLLLGAMEHLGRPLWEKGLQME